MAAAVDTSLAPWWVARYRRAEPVTELTVPFAPAALQSVAADAVGAAEPRGGPGSGCYSEARLDVGSGEVVLRGKGSFTEPAYQAAAQTPAMCRRVTVPPIPKDLTISQVASR